MTNGGVVTVHRGRWYILLTGFLAIVLYFAQIDVYHHHFFDSGGGIFVYNLVRVAFVVYFAWIVYFVGYAFLSVVGAPLSRQTLLTPVERTVLAFGTGLGVLHVGLLILGEFSLYYRWLVVAVCAIIVVASARHLGELFTQAKAAVPLHPSRVTLAAVATICVAGIYLLLAGLYPGGSGDFYTHYFYYYLAVLNNHGLQPNDVWYHFYYSKGAGLTFLGMLLADPEAPELVTFVCVAMAGLGIASLSARLIPRSMWPALAVGLYFMACVFLEGDFQKSHEETTALIVLTVWALCMRLIGPAEWRKALLVMAASTLVAMATLEIAAALIFETFLVPAMLFYILRRNADAARDYATLTLISVLAIVINLTLNWVVTGLASDQALSLMLRFANIERLDQLGLVPQIILVAWIRDSYAATVANAGTSFIAEILDFTRMNFLWVVVGSAAIALGAFAYRRRTGSARPTSPSSRRVAVFMAAMVGILAVVSPPAAGNQIVSYERFSAFFLPLALILSIACWAIVIDSMDGKHLARWTVIAPCALLAVTLLVGTPSLATGMAKSATPLVNFALGRLSLAQAYESRSGLDPSAFTMFEQVPSGSRVWSTNVYEYCMAPGCVIESVVSFRLSPRLNDVLNGSPEEARAVLQSEGLNYFIFSGSHPMLDILPYSRLFSPQTIGDYLGIKWTNGTDYLLTWRAPNVQPLDADFMRSYVAQVNGNAENPLFKFGEFPPYLNSTMTALRARPHPWRSIDFTWRHSGLR